MFCLVSGFSGSNSSRVDRHDSRASPHRIRTSLSSGRLEALRNGVEIVVKEP
jgi:hypothetical protein